MCEKKTLGNANCGLANITPSSKMYVKIDKTLLKFCKKFDKITETSDENFEKFAWNVW